MSPKRTAGNSNFLAVVKAQWNKPIFQTASLILNRPASMASAEGGAGPRAAVESVVRHLREGVRAERRVHYTQLLIDDGLILPVQSEPSRPYDSWAVEICHIDAQSEFEFDSREKADAFFKAAQCVEDVDHVLMYGIYADDERDGVDGWWADDSAFDRP